MYSSLLQFFGFNTPSAGRLLRSGLLLFALALFIISRTAQAVSPPPDGGYPNDNTAEGTDALFSLTTGIGNTAIGARALNLATNGNYNTATGFEALTSNTTGFHNTATGAFALLNNTTGQANTATGLGALSRNTSGEGNTATGFEALDINKMGNFNTATGFEALFNNTIGNNNTATGFSALANNNGNNNVANGYQALADNTAGVGNTATGFLALNHSQTGINNTANGRQALQNNTTGSFNIAVGNLAGRNLTAGSNNIDIGNQGVAAEARTIRIGEQGIQTKTFVAGISGSPIAGTSVVVNGTGRLGTVASSQRFKNDIKPMDKASQAILALKPVTFHYKKDVDSEGVLQFGLVAEQVEKVNPDLVVRDQEGKPYTVRYEAVNAMLLNEFLKEHRKNEEQQATIDRQQKQIERLTATVQKVSDQLELNKTAPRVATND